MAYSPKALGQANAARREAEIAAKILVKQADPADVASDPDFRGAFLEAYKAGLRRWGEFYGLQAAGKNAKLAAADLTDTGLTEPARLPGHKLFKTLLAFRSERLNPERVRALALIDVVFSNDAKVRAKWKEYYEALNNPAYVNNPNQGFIFVTKENEMLAAMARRIGYGNAIGYEELVRQYAPQAFADNAALQAAMQQEALRVLRATENFGTPRVAGTESSAAPAPNGPTGIKTS